MQVVRRDPEKGYLDTLFWIPKSKVNVEGAKAALTFEFFDERRARYLFLWKETASHLLVPREFWDPSECEFPTVDCRPRIYPKVEIHSNIVLDCKDPSKTTQRDALAALLNNRGGILQLGCGKGKTVIALELSSREAVPTIIIVDNTQLMIQWQDAIKQHLVVPGGVGLIQGDVFDWERPIVLATYQTLAQHADTLSEEIRRRFGLIIWDEGHHMAAPTWAKSADLFYGKRITLTATPERTDGYHVIYDFHVGKVIYKDLSQDLKPDFYFLWTGLNLNLEDPNVRTRVLDTNGELHISKIATYFATWRERLEKILTEVRAAVGQGRRIIVLSKSVDELINLLALWNGIDELYTEIPWPTPEEVGETLAPAELTKKDIAKLNKSLALTQKKLKDRNLNPAHRKLLDEQQNGIRRRLDQHEIFKKAKSLREKRQKEYLKELLALPSNAGIMIHRVKPAERTAMLRSKQVMFAISKYGREGLDEERLDTIIASFPVSDRNGLQQLMGRIQRKKAGKKRCVCVFLEDEVGLLIAMCKNIRKHLRGWPAEDGGPYTYSNIGHPQRDKRSGEWKKEMLRVSGQSLATASPGSLGR